MERMPLHLHGLAPLGGLPAPAVYALALGLGLALTLALAAWLTPRHWWWRPTLRGGAVLACGTLACGALLLALAGRTLPALDAAAPQPVRASAQASAFAPARVDAPGAPGSGLGYRVIERLNLRQDHGVHAARLAVLPAGSRVIASGASDGDWWQVRARVDGRELSGWTSSLWLRRSEEGTRTRAGGG